MQIFDLGTSNGTGDCTEIGAGITLADSYGHDYSAVRLVSPDGGTLFILGDARILARREARAWARVGGRAIHAQPIHSSNG